MRTNQNSTPNPSPEGDQSDPEAPVFLIFRAIIPYISNVTQSSGLLPIAAASYRWEPQLEFGNKNSLAFASDIGSLVVIERFHDLGITPSLAKKANKNFDTVVSILAYYIQVMLHLVKI